MPPFFCPRFTLHWSMKERCTLPHAANWKCGGWRAGGDACASIYQVWVWGRLSKRPRKSSTCGWIVRFCVNSRKCRDYCEAERVCCVSTCMCIGVRVFTSTVEHLFTPAWLWNWLVHVEPWTVDFSNLNAISLFHLRSLGRQMAEAHFGEFHLWSRLLQCATTLHLYGDETLGLCNL